MDSFNDNTLSAYFPGLVDVCINDDDRLVYAIRKGEDLIFASEYITEIESLSIPERELFQFTIPRAAEVSRYFVQEDNSLYDDLLAYLKRFSALDEEQWAIVAHYVFLTYLHDHPGIDYCPYILFNAVPERGKSRTGKSIIYVAFRGIHLVELREATIFRYSQYFHGTLFFDLMDISKKAERGNCEDILLLRYEKGAQCIRILHADQGPFKDMVSFKIYSPTIIASNEPLHRILETRCLPINMPNIPGNYENPRPEFALELKERFTAWRAKHLVTEFPNINPIKGIDGRLWDITKPLFLMNRLLPVSHQILQDSIIAIASEKNASMKESVEGRLVAIIKEITDREGFTDSVEWRIKVNDIRSGYNQGRPEDHLVSSQWVGKRLKSMSFRHRIVHGYSEIVINVNEYSTILKQYGYAGRESAKYENSLPDSLPEKAEQDQSLLKEVESGRESGQVQECFDLISPAEQKIYEETIKILKEKESEISQEEMERLAKEYVISWRKREDAYFESQFLKAKI